MLEFFNEGRDVDTVTILNGDQEEIRLLFEQYKKAESFPAKKKIVEKLLIAELNSMEKYGLSI
jgi:hypothetical protein